MAYAERFGRSFAAIGPAESLDVAKSEAEKDNFMAKASEDPAERLAALKKKIKDQQAIQDRIEERKKAKEKEMAESWKAHQLEVKEERKAERQRLQESIQKACSPREPRSERRTSETEGKADVSPDDIAVDTVITPIPPKYRDKIRVPDPPTELKQWKIHKNDRPLKPRLPAEATPSIKKKNANQSSAKSQQLREKSIVQQLPQLFPGLRRTNDGQQILEAGAPAVMPEQSLMPRKALLRKAQVKLLNNLSDQVSFYRGHMRRNFNRILEATELEFSDVAGRRQQAAWNLAKPLSITEIKQTKRQMRDRAAEGP
eukprot:gnl/MRDRNA2_/MRDRNA2_27012_c0_seq1.p1 gnl/MRDRNA2_/MRDRNA2_27012_c0~~gnl/MRDRNA2_/MRDRNA2_27012_c0_seq1.p1  ORF type:complete len:314 (-),score=84.23 gnl/MRDRNA2_/MRDRNA2_27012_c0_seq1:105-1046(-)